MIKWKEVFLYILAAVIVLGELAMIVFMLVIWKSGASTVDSNVINLIYGLALGYHSGFTIVLGYYFGSSKGSADKNLIIGKTEENKA
jgi:steroid 5-alpha reductase family enzyme